jgi:hypothetical protein
MSDKHRVPETELSDSEDEGDNRRDIQSFEKDDQIQMKQGDAPPAADEAGSANDTPELFETYSTQSTGEADGMDTTE